MLPKNIWMLWLQGFAQAPPLIEKCVDSWRRHNPDWTLHLVTQENVTTYLDATLCDQIFNTPFSVQKQANLLRLALLSRHGGVWADADCYCTKPLDDWIHEATREGFFAFTMIDENAWFCDPSVSRWQRLTRRGNDRILANWFLAAMPNNMITTDFLERHFALLMMAHRHRKTPTPARASWAIKQLRRNSYLASMMATPVFVRKFRSFHYYIFHHHLARLVRTDPSFRRAWEKVPAIPTPRAAKYRFRMHHPVNQAVLNDMAGKGSPVLKLNHNKAESHLRGQLTVYGWVMNGPHH